VTLGAVLYVGSRPIGTAPPLGGLLEPANGVWALARAATLPADASGAIPGLTGAVTVEYDERGVPHVFASNVHDAARAIGYVHARDRLFQLELQTRAVAGTIAELAGARAAPLDRTARAQGLADAADRAWSAFPDTSVAKRLAVAYAEGVNAYIDAMPRAALPFEFRLMGKAPQRWEPRYTAYLFMRMGLTLGYSDSELRRPTIEELVGAEAADALFPAEHPLQDPIQPNGTAGVRADWKPLPPPRPRAPQVATSERAAGVSPWGEALTGSDDVASADERRRYLDDAAVGSNNWVVSPRRSASGHALLAGDPHLALSLPAIWYQAHIVVPDTLDVYGATLLGAPIPPIGFSRALAWTVTNTGADVADYFVETVNDSASPTQYRLDGEWKPLRLRVETIRDNRGRSVAVDTIRETHRGPMLHRDGKWISRRWTVTDGHDAIRPLFGVAMASSVRDALTALDSFNAPAQNFALADSAGHIGLRSTGLFPIRSAKAPRGDVLIDGSRSENDWQGRWRVQDYPQAYDPPQGFASSANQQPKDPRVDRRFLGADWPSPWRAMRINTLLRADSAATPNSMRLMQVDAYSAQPEWFVPAVVAAASGDTALASAAALLDSWNRSYRAEERAPVLFEALMAELAALTWDELLLPASPSGGSPAGARRRVDTPQSSILAGLLRQPESEWWDDRSTRDIREHRDDILRRALGDAWRSVNSRLGPLGDAWARGATRRANVRHLLLPNSPLSRPNVPIPAGGPGSLTPSSGDGNHSASWRMVVELGNPVRAWGIYPGGQSGNPVSPRYDDLLGRWSAGSLDSLRTPRAAGELTRSQRTARLVLRP